MKLAKEEYANTVQDIANQIESEIKDIEIQIEALRKELGKRNGANVED